MLKKIKLPAFLSRLPRRALWILLALVILIAGGGYAYYRLAYLPNQTDSEPDMQTTTARQGDLVIYASGSGTLIPAAESSLGFRTSGQVTRINVKVGDLVQAGQVLAELDNVTQQIQYAQAKRALEDLASPYAIATAEQDLANAQ
jgi:macrolide-specific efflux system membrane fusion protein